MDNYLLDLEVTLKDGKIVKVTKIYKTFKTEIFVDTLAYCFSRKEQLELIERYKDDAVLTETEKTVVSALKNVVVSPIETEK